MYVHVRRYMHACIHSTATPTIYISILKICVYVSMCACMYVFMYVCMYSYRMYLCMCVCIHTSAAHLRKTMSTIHSLYVSVCICMHAYVCRHM